MQRENCVSLEKRQIEIKSADHGKKGEGRPKKKGGAILSGKGVKVEKNGKSRQRIISEKE